MNPPVVDLPLPGCAPVPLAHYLKALGILRLVSEQRDANAKGFWKNDIFHLASALDRDALVKFFLSEYRPTPIIAPWNGGSGFFYREEKSKEKDPLTGKLIITGQRNQATAATRAVDAIGAARSDRFIAYGAAVRQAKEILRTLGITAAPKEESKAKALSYFRSQLPDPVVAWFDAVILLAGDGPSYPPLLGVGGTDGNLDFTCNFVQRLLEVI